MIAQGNTLGNRRPNIITCMFEGNPEGATYSARFAIHIHPAPAGLNEFCHVIPPPGGPAPGYHLLAPSGPEDRTWQAKLYLISLEYFHACSASMIAPTGRKVIAQGNALGNGRSDIPHVHLNGALKGRHVFPAYHSSRPFEA